MRFRFRERRLEERYTTGAQGWHQPGVVRRFFLVMAQIDAAGALEDLRAFQSLRLHELKGDRTGQWAMDLSGNMRLILALRRDADGDYLELIEIADYH